MFNATSSWYKIRIYGNLKFIIKCTTQPTRVIDLYFIYFYASVVMWSWNNHHVYGEIWNANACMGNANVLNIITNINSGEQLIHTLLISLENCFCWSKLSSFPHKYIIPLFQSSKSWTNWNASRARLATRSAGLKCSWGAGRGSCARNVPDSRDRCRYSSTHARRRPTCTTSSRY